MILLATGSQIICCPWFRKSNVPWGLVLSSDVKGGKAAAARAAAGAVVPMLCSPAEKGKSLLLF